MSLMDESRQSGLGIRRLKAKLHDSARRADVHSRESGNLQDILGQFNESNSYLRQTNSGTLATHLFILLLIPAVYCLDFLLFASTAENLAEKVFYDMPLMAWVARIIVPALIIIVEMTLALLIFSTKRDAETYYGPKMAYRGWLLLGILFALVMPSLVIGTNLIQASFESESVQKAIHWQLIGLVTLALVTHILVIFSGRLAHEAKSFLIHKVQHGSLQRRIKKISTEYEHERQSFRREFDSFYDILSRHRNTFQDNFDPGPFDIITRNFARAIYGYEVIQPADSFKTPPVQGETYVEEHEMQNDNQSFDDNNETDPRVKDEESEVRV